MRKFQFAAGRRCRRPKYSVARAASAPTRELPHRNAPATIFDRHSQVLGFLCRLSTNNNYQWRTGLIYDFETVDYSTGKA